MKKILFLLLCTVSMYGQVSTGQEQEFDYGIKNNSTQTVTTPTYLGTVGADGTYGKILLADLQGKKAFLSTGLIKNGLISANGDPTKFNITAGIGIISNFDDPENPISTLINFPAFTGITPTYLLTGTITYVAINSTPAVVMQATPFTPEQRRSLIILGAVIHSNLTTINLLNNISAPSNASTNQLHDFIEAVGSLNLTGNKYTANGANLQLDKSAGLIFKLGSNFANDWKNPHELAQTAGTSLTFRYRTQNGTEGSDRVNLDPALYDLSNVLTAVPNNKFTIQTVTMFQSGVTRIQYGQNVYDDLATAKNAVFTRNFVLEPNSKENGIIRAYIIMKNTTTSLQNVADADILETQKFGGVASGGVALTLANIVTALGFTPENVANKSDSYTSSSSTTYSSTKALVDGLALKANLTGANFTGNIGIGTTAGVALDIAGTTFATSQIRTATASNTDNSVLAFRRSRAGNTAILNGDTIGNIAFRGHDGTSIGSDVANISVMATQNFTPSVKGTSMNFQVTPIGSTSFINPFNIYGTKVSVDYDFSNPTNVESGFVSTILGKGDNTTYKGVIAGTFNSKDRPDVTGANKGVLIGLNVGVNTLVARNNVPFDDANGIMVNNDGIGKATDGIYFTKNSTSFNSTSQWLTLLTSDSNTDYGIRFMGTHSLEYLNFGNKFSVDNNGKLKSSNIEPITNNTYSIGTDVLNYLTVRANTVNSNTALTFDTFNNNSIIFKQGNVEKMRLFNTGNFSIGNSSDTHRLSVTGATRLDGAVTITGIPTAPTASLGTNTTQLATTAYVLANSMALTGSQTLTGRKTFTSDNTTAGGISITNAKTSTATVGDNAGMYVSNTGSFGVYIETTGGDGILAKSLTNGNAITAQSFGTGTALTLRNQGGTGDLLSAEVGATRITSAGKLLSNNFETTGTMKMKEYTVATLPTPTGTAYATVTDALSPTYMATVVGGGAVVTPVFYNGTNWVAH